MAEQWDRRWITCDTSRVPLALARQRLLTATFDYYKLKVEQVSRDLLNSGLIPVKAANDALHLAVAAVHRMHFLQHSVQIKPEHNGPSNKKGGYY